MTHRESGVRDFAEEQDAGVPTPEEEMGPEEFEEFLSEARQMALTREQKTRIASTEATLKENLMKRLAKFGQPYGDSGQHRTIEFPRPIRGIKRFVRQTKVSTGVDEAVAQDIALQRGFYNRLFKKVYVMDDAMVPVLLDEGLLTDEDVARIFPKTTSYAFVVEKK